MGRACVIQLLRIHGLWRLETGFSDRCGLGLRRGMLRGESFERQTVKIFACRRIRKGHGGECSPKGRCRVSVCEEDEAPMDEFRTRLTSGRTEEMQLLDR